MVGLKCAVTKWTKACDKRLARLISYIHHTCEYMQYCYVGNNAFQIHARRTPKGGDTFIFPVEDGTVKLSGGDQGLRTSTLIRDNPDRGEEQGNLPGESEACTNTTFKWRT